MNHPLIGLPAPDFSATSYDGFVFTLSVYKDVRSIVLFFYPKDDSPGCTAEACAFRDSMLSFETADALVVAISPDTPESHRAFAKKHGITYPLLSDTQGNISRLYQVPRDFWGLIPGRETYVIDKKGIIRGVFHSAFQFKRHVQEALRLLNE